MRDIVLSYSIDNGDSWSSEYTFRALRVWCDLNPEFETSGSESRRMGTTAKICQKPTPRLKIDIELSWTNFNPLDQPSSLEAQTNWQFMQYWICAPLRRLYIPNGSSHYVWSEFDADDNENYVNIDNWDYTYEDAENVVSERKIRSIKLELSARNATTVAYL